MLLKNHTGIVGIHVHCGNVYYSLRTIDLFSRTSVSVVLGGPEATERYSFFLQQFPNLLGVIRGEGDNAFIQLINALLRSDTFDRSQIHNLVYVENDKINCTQNVSVNINKLPFPKWGLFDLSQ